MESGASPVIEGSVPGMGPVSTQAGGLKHLLRAFIKYLLVGGIAFAVDFALFSTCLSAGLHYLPAVCVGFIGGLLTNYALCVAWVWRGTQARSLRDLLVFALVGVGGLALTSLGMWIGIDVLDAPERASRIVMAALVLVWNFGLRRAFVFFR
ncbi:GtrA family protein [Viridibacterium curvum]|uniref:GtrA/DPMS transmembrane domain-containing protein n=1 Tax=Viridibacterium curvum TaxID=1101404 RepID=A0ABP9QMA1_9RHOO